MPPRVKFRVYFVRLSTWSIVLHKAVADADKHHGDAEDGEAYPGEQEIVPADHVGEITEYSGSGDRRHIA